MIANRARVTLKFSHPIDWSQAQFVHARHGLSISRGPRQPVSLETSTRPPSLLGPVYIVCNCASLSPSFKTLFLLIFALSHFTREATRRSDRSH
ncbi:hypothetical protein OUZ56_019757 [Daphnia magna]|uniref:Uncharacterized protein n=1 Tax=Daphnia magna TaxID=35525 RepID=A0ABQ9ZCI5_9CRUS|nr:hypothetical protein OUZ56_019757 [Daphnia magna]